MPIDHEYFDDINLTQWYWYFYNIREDQEEEFKLKRDLIEYHASFIEPELVDKTRKRRNEAAANTQKDGQFANTLKNLFGRDVGFKDKPANESGFKNINEVKDILSKIDEYDMSQKRIKSHSKYNFIDWLNFNLE